MGWQKQQEQYQISVNTTARRSNVPVEICSCLTDMQNLLLTYSDASTIQKVIN